jgi:tetratricopeptide (TPR) repeat protein
MSPSAPAADGGSSATQTIAAPPGFEYWIAEAAKLFDADTPNYAAMLFCAEKGPEAAPSDVAWAQAKDTVGVAQFYLHKIDDAIGTFSEIIERSVSSIDTDMRTSRARALFNKGFALTQLGRSDESIVAYDDVIAGFGAALELPLREEVATALFTKGWTLGQLGRSNEAITAYDDVIARLQHANCSSAN